MLHVNRGALNPQLLSTFTMQAVSSPAKYMGALTEYCSVTGAVTTLVLCNCSSRIPDMWLNHSRMITHAWQCHSHQQQGLLRLIKGYAGASPHAYGIWMW